MKKEWNQIWLLCDRWDWKWWKEKEKMVIIVPAYNFIYIKRQLTFWLCYSYKVCANKKQLNYQKRTFFYWKKKNKNFHGFSIEVIRRKRHRWWLIGWGLWNYGEKCRRYSGNVANIFNLFVRPQLYSVL